MPVRADAGSGPRRAAAVNESTADAVAQAMGFRGAPPPARPPRDAGLPLDAIRAGGGDEPVAAGAPIGDSTPTDRPRFDAPIVDSARADLATGDAPTAEAPTAEAPTAEAPMTGSMLSDSPARRERLPGAGARPMPVAAHVVVPGSPVDAELARRIARALISELLLARREQHNDALRDGRLLTRLGQAILEAHERYRERVGAELADGATYFQDAVNDILGDGRRIL